MDFFLRGKPPLLAFFWENPFGFFWGKKIHLLAFFRRTPHGFAIASFPPLAQLPLIAASTIKNTQFGAILKTWDNFFFLYQNNFSLPKPSFLPQLSNEFLGKTGNKRLEPLKQLIMHPTDPIRAGKKLTSEQTFAVS